MKAFVKSFRGKLFFWALALSTVFLLICSKSSPLYPMNDWVDVHCFFTMGRGILQGLVPYRDLYEQKGPVLYFLYALAALVSDKSFWGVFLLEIATFTLFLYYSGKIAMLYLGNSRLIYLVLLLLAPALTVSSAFSHGGGAEQLCLFFISYSLYSVLRALKKERVLTLWEAFFNGVCATCVLFIKFTIVGFYLGLALFVIVWYASCRYSFRHLTVTVGQFLLGVGSVCALIILYFGIHGAIDDLFTVYFYNNLFLYPVETEGSKLTLIEKCLKSTLQYNGSYSWYLTLGIILFLPNLKKSWRSLLLAVFSFTGLVIGTYWGGRGYTYYGLILAPFAVFGLTALARLLQVSGVLEDAKLCFQTPITTLALILCLCLGVHVAFDKSGNTYLMGYEKQEHPAYRFAQIIEKEENPTLLNFGFLDGGFYYAAQVTPSCEFFCTLNINAPDMWTSQYQAINDGTVDFVITRNYTLDRYYVDSSRYMLVDQAVFPFEGYDFTYYLYQKT